MPPLPGEERLVTLYADVHYYFAKPITRPIQHRFDKASYFYVYYNATRQTSRVEIANNPGTEFQDAFNGQLEKCRVKNSYTFPTLLTLEVEGVGRRSSPTSTSARDSDEWRLESGDPNDKKREKHKLHTLDIYFWTQEDARLAVDFFKKLLGPSQLDIVELPNVNAGTQEISSPVVRNLESVAVSDPAYGNGQTRDSQNQPQARTINLPPPPPAPQSGSKRSSLSAHSQTTVDKSRGERISSPASQKSAADYTPIAYNPAAPAAPEPRAHREKTPPPEDDTEGSGLKAAAAQEHGYNQSRLPPQPYTRQPALQQPQYGHYGSPPPPSATPGYRSQSSLGYASPPPPPPPSAPQQQHAARSSVRSPAPSFAPPPVSTTPGYGTHSPSTEHSTPSPVRQPTRSSQVSTAMTFGPPPSNALAGHEIHSHSHSSAAEHYTPDHQDYQDESAETPGTEFYRTLEQPAKPLQHIRPQYPDVLADKTSPAPPGSAYSQHAHGQRLPPGRHDSDPYGVHNQVYRPTEQESQSHRKPSRPSKDQSATSRIDSTADKLKGKFMKHFG